MDATQTPKRFRLSFVGASEDVPRLIRAYGRACDGEFGLVLRPTERRGLLVLIRKDGALLWRGEKGDAPVRPETAVSSSGAVNQVRLAQDDLPTEGPITLRGQWAGFLHCDGGVPRVELQRKVASYGTLRIESRAGEGWVYTVDRADTWFTDKQDKRGSKIASLADAINQGVRAAMDLVAPACSFRDTRRRAAVDASYAEKHPVKPAREQRDPTTKLKAKPDKKAAETPTPGEQPPAPTTRRRGKAPKPADAPVTLPPAPKDADALAEVSRVLQSAAAQLPEQAELGDAGLQDLIAAEETWLAEHDLPQAATLMSALGDDLRIQSWTEANAPVVSLQQILAELDARAKDDDPPAPAVLAEARARIHALREAIESRSPILARARWLLRYADQAARSPKCRGSEQEEALAALSKAQAAYEAARASFTEGKSADSLRELRKVAEALLLSAAKIARSCKAGQTGLFTSGKKRGQQTAPPEPPKEPKKRGRPRKNPEPEAEAAPQVDPELDRRLMDDIESRLRKILNA